MTATQTTGGDEDYFDAPADERSGISIKAEILEWKDRAKHKSKRLFTASSHRRHDPSAQSEDDLAQIDSIRRNAAFDTSQLEADQKTSSAVGKAASILRTTARAVKTPKTTLKRGAIAKVAIKERPYLSQQADADYLAAHDDLGTASDPVADSDDGGLAKTSTREKRLDELKDSRDARKVAWFTTRHVQRIAVVTMEAPQAPNPGDFYVKNDPMGRAVFDRKSYIFARNRYHLKLLAITSMGDVDVRPQEPFSKEVCTKLLERILIATAPWQTWALNLRSLYRWEDPKKTAKWTLIWFFIWYVDYVITFVFCWTAFITLENRFRPKRAEALRDSKQRSGDASRMAYRLDELIERHGPGGWADPLIEQAGPNLQMQLSDLADFLEVLANFYDWTSPFRTWATLFWFATAIAVGALTPTGYSMKIVSMFVLLNFFLGRPIASRHPQYRHAVNALKWIFWAIPNDAEWSFTYLRRTAQEFRERLIAKRVAAERESDESSSAASDDTAGESFVSIGSDPPSPALRPSLASHHSNLLPADEVLISFKARHVTRPCTLQILPTGLAIRPRHHHCHHILHPSSTAFDIPYHTLREIRKLDPSPLAKATTTSTTGSLELVTSCTPPTTTTTTTTALRIRLHDDDDDVHPLDEARLAFYRIDALRDRDDVFNLILAFSGLKFQNLPPVPPSREGG